MSGCGSCAKIRAHLPAAIRARLEQVEARIRARRVNVSISYRVDLIPKEKKSSPFVNDERALK